MEQENVAIYKLNDAREKLDLLKKNLQNLDIRSILESAAKLRDNVCNDQIITDCCSSVSGISDLRKTLLDDIRNLQVNIIKDTVKLETSDTTSSDVVVDFDKAKISLSKMIDTELETNMFSETEEPHLFDNIKDCKVHLSTLHRVNDNCQHDKYKVLIMGDFQSGKSTTLDAICDGRHISAIGDGTATSAVLVSATYAEDESVNVLWRNKEQFNTIFDRIKKYLPDFDWGAFDLDDTKARKQLALAIDVFRQSKDCPSVREGDAKFLMLSDFVLRYYGTSELKEKKTSLRSISDISDITRFPKNGESIWNKSGVSDFCIDDAIFIFIERVDCYIRSNTLKDLNCTIIDSPGLFNSSYDTMVTEAAMIDAHAIMYVLPYHKGIGEDVCKSLFTIRDNYKDVHTKLLIVNNLRLTGDNIFFDSNCEQIRSMFGSNKSVYRYDAKLSYLAQLKKSYCSGLLTIKDYAHLLQVTKHSFSGKKTKLTFTTFEEAWNYQIRKYTSTSIDANDRPNDILDESGFANMIFELKHFIAENKAYAVILSMGLVPMTKELESIKSSLYRLYIEPFSSSFDDLVKLWSKRIEKAEKIQTFMLELVNKELFEDKGKGSLCKRISDEESSKLFTSDFYQDLAEEISGVLYDNKAKLLCTKALFKSNKNLFKQRFIQLATPWIQAKIVDLVSRKILYLLSLIESEQDATVNNMFSPVMDKVEEGLKSEWRSQYKDDKSFKMKDYLVISKNLNVSKNEDVNQNSYNTDALSSNLVDLTLFGGIVAQLSVTVAGVAAMVAGYITAIFCDPSGATFLVAVILGLGGTIVTAFAPNAIRNEFIKILSKQIYGKIESGAAVSFRKIVQKQITNAFNKYVGNLKVNIQKMKNERDMALTPNPNQENLCFRAVEAIVEIDNQLNKYEEYEQENIRKKAN